MQKSAIAFAGFSAGTADDLPGAFFQKILADKKPFSENNTRFLFIGAGRPPVLSVKGIRCLAFFDAIQWVPFCVFIRGSAGYCFQKRMNCLTGNPA
ncbi:hypothetical protein [Faecalispora jeddahensis]|uniref:hypothetical protein n=2 Tax=Faecalispora jeddahensis TaxID=1414721 RepID=UPI0011C7D749|nr:hypothetical protein [Faecalispora jeddahensis]MBE6744459.1 hypothetical protein [Oscillospiraceae bacterium]